MYLMKKVLVFTVLLSVVSVYAQESGIIYNETQGTTHATIQEAVNTSVDGDIILVGPGEYAGDIDMMGKAITVRSAKGPESTYITDVSTFGFHCWRNESRNTVIDGFTITGMVFMGSPGGICVYINNSSPTIKNCRFAGNSCMYNNQSGAILNVGGNPKIMNCQFSHNRSLVNGAAISNIEGMAAIINCTFNENYCEYSANGGAVYNFSSTVHFYNCRFLSNSSWEDGSGGYGGAVYNNQSVTNFYNCLFRANRGSKGGALWIGDGCTTSITNCSFIANYSNNNGGSAILMDSDVTVVNSLFAHPDSGYPTFNIRSGTLNATYSCFTGIPPTGTGNIRESRPILDSNGAPLKKSACIDAGSNYALPQDSFDIDQDGNTSERLPQDLGGNTRCFDTPDIPDTGAGSIPIVDIGAFEFIETIEINPADLDTDGDVDLNDYALFQAAFSGPL